jgi:ribose transport system permease protein
MTMKDSPSTTEVRPKRRINLGIDRFSGLYVWAALVIIFSLWIPDLFLRVDTIRNIASEQAIVAILALGLVIPFAAGAFDLTIAATMGLSVCVTVWGLLQGYSILIVLLLSILVGASVGLFNALVVVRFQVSSFIATLGMSSILAAAAFFVTGGTQLALSQQEFGSFLEVSRAQFLGLPLPVYYMIVIAAILWWVLEYTPGGRYLYAVGGNPVAARLAGVRVGRVVMVSFLVSGVVSAIAGIFLAARLGIASPQVGLPYLLPTFAAVFLGATQIRPGRVNVLGTLVAIFLLATGVKGLQLAGAPNYVTDLFNGAALIIAVALAARTTRKRS